MIDWEEFFSFVESNNIVLICDTAEINVEEMYQAFKARMEHELGLNKPTRKTKPKEYSRFENDLFNSFWGAGMAKSGDKQKTKAKYIALLQGKPLFHAMILTDIATRIENEQYGFDTLYPLTYLNGARWNDEIIEVKPQTIKLPKDIMEVQKLAVENGVRASNPGEEPWDYRIFVKAEFERMGI